MKPMFDDPKKELERLERALLQSEEEPGEDELDLEEVKAYLAEDDWEGTDREPLYRRYADIDWQDEADEEPEEEPADYQPAPPRKKGIAGLMILLLMETAALVAVIAWWIRWLG